ncbi:MAG: hypothetical protein JW913_00750 [Chitinispirillaceae bacterium]|nr:hypothetical protein [Chitinispirillaceae bacterium]
MKPQAASTAAVIAALALFFIADPTDGASEQIPADPNCIASGFEYGGTLQLKAGDRLTIGWLDIGGFIETRNDPCFNQGLLPNHNWRGVLAGHFSYPLIREMQSSLSLFTGLEHESSHATMGIVESISDPYGMIYDRRYRRSMLNALPVGAELVMYDQVNRLVLRGSGAWYFFSKNTPELPGLETGNSGGVTLGGSYCYLFGKLVSCFVSVHERFIFSGTAERTGDIYIAGDNGSVVERRDYPVINRINTVTVRGGISLPLFESRRLLDVYVRYLYGHCYGYVDSRKKLSIVAAGAMVRGR